MVFCNTGRGNKGKNKKNVTILILIDGFLQYEKIIDCLKHGIVTILILIDGFLQFDYDTDKLLFYNGHNPYFNRWFSAIALIFLLTLPGTCHNPYFNRWFSAICEMVWNFNIHRVSHNPYFNRWFSAIKKITLYSKSIKCHNPYFNRWFSAIILKELMDAEKESHNPYFNRWFSAII